MRRILFAGGSFLIGDGAAEALCEYAASLANAGRAAALIVPTRTEDGTIDEIEVVLGPASQLVSEPVATDLPTGDDGEFVGGVREAIAALEWHPPTTTLLEDWEY